MQTTTPKKKRTAEPRVRVVVALSPDVYTRLLAHTQEQSVSLTEWMRVVIAAALDRETGTPVPDAEV